MHALAKLATAAAVAAGAIAARHRRSASPHAPRGLTDDDRAHAERWVVEEIQRLRALGYDELRRCEGQSAHSERVAASGARFMCGTSVFWDDAKAGTLRVLVDVAHLRPGWTLPTVARDDFIRAPDGSFIGE